MILDLDEQLNCFSALLIQVLSDDYFSFILFYFLLFFARVLLKTIFLSSDLLLCYHSLSSSCLSSHIFFSFILHYVCSFLSSFHSLFLFYIILFLDSYFFLCYLCGHFLYFLAKVSIHWFLDFLFISYIINLFFSFIFTHSFNTLYLVLTFQSFIPTQFFP